MGSLAPEPEEKADVPLPAEAESVVLLEPTAEPDELGARTGHGLGGHEDGPLPVVDEERGGQDAAHDAEDAAIGQPLILADEEVDR